MSRPITQFRVFLASPSGMESDRDRIRNTIALFNEDEAYDRGVVFSVSGWEKVAPGIGRPQSRINVVLEECDYFILCMHNRWGSFPGSAGERSFSSGSEEEFELALKCHRDALYPMRDMAVYFRTQPPPSIEDDRSQYNLVVQFKKKLAKNRTLLYAEYKKPQELTKLIKILLTSWIRDIEKSSDASSRANVPGSRVLAKNVVDGVASTGFSKSGSEKRFDLDAVMGVVARLTKLAENGDHEAGKALKLAWGKQDLEPAKQVFEKRLIRVSPISIDYCYAIVDISTILEIGGDSEMAFSRLDQAYQSGSKAFVVGLALLRSAVKTDRYQRALEIVPELLSENHGNLKLWQDIKTIEGIAYLRHGQCEMADKAFLAVYDRIENDDASDTACRVLFFRAGANFEHGNYEVAGEIGRAAIHRAEVDGYVDMAYRSRSVVALALAMKGNYKESRRLLEEMLEYFRENSITDMIATACVNMAFVDLKEAQFSSALTQANLAASYLESIHERQREKVLLGYIRANTGLALWFQGDRSAASAAIAAAHSLLIRAEAFARAQQAASWLARLDAGDKAPDINTLR